MTQENFHARLKQAKLAAKHDTANSVNSTNYDKKLININKKLTLNKIKQNMSCVKRK